MGTVGPCIEKQKYHDANQVRLYTVDVHPYSYHQEIPDQSEAEGSVRSHTRNLVVAATGTGKTVISALDYKRFRRQNPGKPNRLLFVAHQEEILQQSLYTFRVVLKNANFGDPFLGSHRSDEISHLFVSIQPFTSQAFTDKTATDFYDYIIVDEFHHAAAPILFIWANRNGAMAATIKSAVQHLYSGGCSGEPPG